LRDGLKETDADALDAHPGSAAQHISPAIEHVSFPCDTPVLASNAKAAKDGRLFAAPSDDGVRYPIMKYRGL
jgi:hypothetical protein